MTSGGFPLSARDECVPRSRAELSKLNDEALMECLKRGQSDGMSLLFERYFRLVLGVALKILRDSGEAEDFIPIAGGQIISTNALEPGAP